MDSIYILIRRDKYIPEDITNLRAFTDRSEAEKAVKILEAFCEGVYRVEALPIEGEIKRR